jgi:hypothetical protein
LKPTEHTRNIVFSRSHDRAYLLRHCLKKAACPLFLVLTVHAASLADSLYEYGHFDLARIEYMREFFFYPEMKNYQHKRLRYAISVCQVDSHEGIRELRLMANDFDMLDPDIRVSMAKQYIILEDYPAARELLDATDEKSLIGYTLILDNRLTNAKALFIAMGKNDIAHDIITFQHVPRKSPRTAAVLSAICPGSGEVYAGNVKQGIKGFLLAAGSGFLIYNAVKKEKYIDALLIFNFLFQRFYMGSIYNAQRSANEVNLKFREKWLARMKHTHFSDLDASP